MSATPEQRAAHLRQLLHGGDQLRRHDRARLSHEQFVNLRDGAWTARDLVSLANPGPRREFWWEQRWPLTTYRPNREGGVA